MSCWKGLGKLPRQTLQERNVLCFKNILFCLCAGFGDLLFRVQLLALSLLHCYVYSPTGCEVFPLCHLRRQKEEFYL